MVFDTPKNSLSIPVQFVMHSKLIELRMLPIVYSVCFAVASCMSVPNYQVVDKVSVLPPGWVQVCLDG